MQSKVSLEIVPVNIVNDGNGDNFVVLLNSFQKRFQPSGHRFTVAIQKHDDFTCVSEFI